MNYIFAVISISGFLAAGGLAVYVLARDPREKLNRLFFAYSLAVSINELLTFLSIISRGPLSADRYYQLSNVFWVLFIVVFFHFCVIFARRETPFIKRIILPIAYLSLPIMSGLSVGTHWFYTIPQMTAFGFFPGFGQYYWAFVLHTVGFLLAQLWLLWSIWRGAKSKREREQGRVIFLALALSFSLGIISDVILPYLGMDIRSLVPLAINIFVIIFAYAMVKYGGLRVTPSALAESIVKTMPDLLVYADTSKQVAMVNLGFGKALGYSNDEIVGRSCSLFHADEKAHQQLHELLSRQGMIAGQQTLLKRKDGVVVPANVSAMVVRDSAGEEVGSLVIYHDISSEQKLLAEQQKLVEELTKNKDRMLSILEDTTAARDEAKAKAVELARALEGLKAVDRMKTEFLSVISHELRTPLTPILGYVGMFLNEQFGKLPPEYLQQAGIIKKESEHLLSLIDSILDVSRLEQGVQLSLDKKPILLRALLADLQEVFKPDYEARQIKIEVDLPADFPTIVGDSSKLHRLFTNLLGNALKFAPRGGWVKVSGRPDGDQVVLEVRDNGIGVAPENLSRIFEKFYQVDGTYTRATGGVGLGLAIAKEIVEAHGGRIRAESPGLGLGTKIVFTLPITG
ncbi:MAG: ATP-binding protein [Candidatus Margulisiibacteriota bacterium]